MFLGFLIISAVMTLFLCAGKWSDWTDWAALAGLLVITTISFFIDPNVAEGCFL